MPKPGVANVKKNREVGERQEKVLESGRKAVPHWNISDAIPERTQVCVTFAQPHRLLSVVATSNLNVPVLPLTGRHAFSRNDECLSSRPI